MATRPGARRDSSSSNSAVVTPKVRAAAHSAHTSGTHGTTHAQPLTRVRDRCCCSAELERRVAADRHRGCDAWGTFIWCGRTTSMHSQVMHAPITADLLLSCMMCIGAKLNSAEWQQDNTASISLPQGGTGVYLSDSTWQQNSVVDLTVGALGYGNELYRSRSLRQALTRAPDSPRHAARHTGVNLVGGGSSQWNVQAYANMVLNTQGNGVFNSYLQTIALGNAGAVVINATDYTCSSSLSFAFMRCSFFSSSCDSSMTVRALHALCFGGCRCSVLPRHAGVLLRC